MVAVSVHESWAREVSTDIAVLVVAMARAEDYTLAEGAFDVFERHFDEELET